MKIVECWKKGYASDEGPTRFEIEDDQDPNVEARKLFGSWATVFHVRDKNPLKAEVFDREYIRMMSNDNS